MVVQTPYSKNVITNIGKVFLKLANEHFPPSNNLHILFNRNTITVTKNLERIIKGHNNALLNKKASLKKKTKENCNRKQKKQLFYEWKLNTKKCGI